MLGSDDWLTVRSDGTCHAQSTPWLESLYNRTIENVCNTLRSIEDEQMGHVAALDAEIEESAEAQRVIGKRRLAQLGIFPASAAAVDDNAADDDDHLLGLGGGGGNVKTEHHQQSQQQSRRKRPREEEDIFAANSEEEEEEDADQQDVDLSLGLSLGTAAPQNAAPASSAATSAVPPPLAATPPPLRCEYDDLEDEVQRQSTEALAAVETLFPLGVSAMRTPNGAALLFDLPLLWRRRMDELCDPSSWLSRAYHSQDGGAGDDALRRAMASGGGGGGGVPSADVGAAPTTRGRGRGRATAAATAAATNASTAASHASTTAPPIPISGPLFRAEALDATVTLINDIILKGKGGRGGGGGRGASSRANALASAIAAATAAASASQPRAVSGAAAGGGAPSSSASSAVSMASVSAAAAAAAPQHTTVMMPATLSETAPSASWITSLRQTSASGSAMQQFLSRLSGGGSNNVIMNNSSVADPLMTPSASSAAAANAAAHTNGRGEALLEPKKPMATTQPVPTYEKEEENENAPLLKERTSTFSTAAIVIKGGTLVCPLPPLDEAERSAIAAQYCWPAAAKEERADVANVEGKGKGLIASAATVVPSYALAPEQAAAVASAADHRPPVAVPVLLPSPLFMSRIQGGRVNLTEAKIEVHGGSLVSIMPNTPITPMPADGEEGTTAPQQQPARRGSRATSRAVGELAVGSVSIQMPIGGPLPRDL